MPVFSLYPNDDQRIIRRPEINI